MRFFKRLSSGASPKPVAPIAFNRKKVGRVATKREAKRAGWSKFRMRDNSFLNDVRRGEPPSNLRCRAALEDDTLQFMPTRADALRRWLGLFCLAVAGGMLIWGQTVLKPHLEGVGFLIYWAVCFLFTFGAIGIALVDMRAVRQRVRSEQEALIRRTLADLEPADETSPAEGESTKGTSHPKPRPKPDEPG